MICATFAHNIIELFLQDGYLVVEISKYGLLERTAVCQIHHHTATARRTYFSW